MPLDSIDVNEFTPLLNKSAAEFHVRLLTGEPDAKVWFRVFDDNKETRDQTKARMFFGTLAECWPQIEHAQADDCGVFVVVNEGGNTDKAIERIRALFVDGDAKPRPEKWHAHPDLIVGTRHTGTPIGW